MALIYWLLVSPLFAEVQSLSEAPSKTHSKGAVIQYLAHPKIHNNKNAFLGRLTVPASGKVPLHRDPTEEYLFILEGSGKIWIDGEMTIIKTNDTIFMPANAQVRFENGPEKLVALQIFAGAGPEKKYENPAWKKKPEKQLGKKKSGK